MTTQQTDTFYKQQSSAIWLASYGKYIEIITASHPGTSAITMVVASKQIGSNLGGDKKAGISCLISADGRAACGSAADNEYRKILGIHGEPKNFLIEYTV